MIQSPLPSVASSEGTSLDWRLRAAGIHDLPRDRVWRRQKTGWILTPSISGGGLLHRCYYCCCCVKLGPAAFLWLATSSLPTPIVVSIDGPWTAASLDLNGALHCEIPGPSGQQRVESNPHTSLKLMESAIELAGSLKQWQEAQALHMPRAIVTLRYSWRIFKSLVQLIS